MRIGIWTKLAGVVLALGLAAATPAAAQPAEEPYRSPMRDPCEQELEKDAAWRASIKDELIPVVHEQESRSIVNNNRHVVMAYAALWIVVVIFVFYMWVRQRRLQAEIERLEREVAEASRET